MPIIISSRWRWIDREWMEAIEKVRLDRAPNKEACLNHFLDMELQKIQALFLTFNCLLWMEDEIVLGKNECPQCLISGFVAR